MGVSRFHWHVSSGSTFAVLAVGALIVLLGSCVFPGPLHRGLMGLSLKDRRLFIRRSFYRHNTNEDDDVENAILGSDSAGPRFCNKETAVLRVFMYDLSPEFHFGMLAKNLHEHIWPRNLSNVPRYPGGLNAQHSPEYWLTLDLLSSAMSEGKHPCTAVLVERPRDADVFFVPFFSSLSYNKYSRSDAANEIDQNIDLQERLVHILVRQNSWRTSGGRNHVIMMHHPNSLLVAREKLRNSIFIVADFGRYSPYVANLDKDIVAPYKHVVPTFKADNATFHTRKTLLFFQGVIVRKEGGKIRLKLYEMLKEEPGIQFVVGTAKMDGIRSASMGMRSSKFCLHLAGDTPSSNRLFDALVSHCVPVIISDNIELPFENELDYTRFSIFVRASDAIKHGFLMNLLQSIKESEWTRMWMTLKQIDHHFEYQHPSKPSDAVNMIWKSIAYRLPAVKLSMSKAYRYSRSRLTSKFD